jgi:NADH-quinone oxidoreductase subunit J
VIISILFYVAAAIAIIATAAVIMAKHAINAVLYLLVSLFSVALMLYTLGGPFVALLEIIVYAGAIIVLFLFVIMMLNIRRIDQDESLRRPSSSQLVLPLGLASLLLLDTALCIYAGAIGSIPGTPISVADVGRVLYRKHYLGVELASLILLIGVIGGMVLGAAGYRISAQKEKKVNDSN